MMQPNEPAYFATPTDYLQQGDIFLHDVVTPVVDIEKRLFRAADGRHGSVVFSEGVHGNVFDEEDLQTHLANLSPHTRTPLHTNPFELTSDGHPEFVVVHSKQTSLFVVATQTCDVSGQAKSVHSTAIILPIVTILDICKYERLFLKGDQTSVTIEAFLDANAGQQPLRSELNPFAYSEKVRAILSAWNPPSTKLNECRNQIKNYLTNMAQFGWMYYLRQDPVFRVPECYIDFSVAYTVPKRILVELSGWRIARIADPYRDQFAQALANHLCRIAVPVPLKPPKY